MLAAVVLSTLSLALSAFSLLSMYEVRRISQEICAAVERFVLLQRQAQELPRAGSE